MRRFAQIALLACLSALAGAALAFDNGQYENVPPDIRAWFKGVIAPNGVPCCDISDGHRTEYDFRVGKRIFATLGHPSEDWGMVKLMREQQTVLVEAEPDIFRPVPGGWGKQGNTNVRLASADQATLQSALTLAWTNVAPKSLASPRGNKKL